MDQFMNSKCDDVIKMKKTWIKNIEKTQIGPLVHKIGSSIPFAVENLCRSRRNPRNRLPDRRE